MNILIGLAPSLKVLFLSNQILLMLVCFDLSSMVILRTGPNFSDSLGYRAIKIDKYYDILSNFVAFMPPRHICETIHEYIQNYFYQ